MKVIGVLTRVARNEKGYGFIEIENSLRLDIGKNEERFVELERLVGRDVVVTVNTEWRSVDGKKFPSRRAIAVRPLDGD